MYVIFCVLILIEFVFVSVVAVLRRLGRVAAQPRSTWRADSSGGADRLLLRRRTAV